MRAALRVVAVCLAVFLAAGETLRSWGADRPLFFVVDDYVMALLLVVAASRARRREGPALLAGAFGFASGMLYGSFFGHLDALLHGRGDPGNIPQHCLTVAIGLAFGAAVIGFALGVREALVATRPSAGSAA